MFNETLNYDIYFHIYKMFFKDLTDEVEITFLKAKKPERVLTKTQVIDPTTSKR